MLFSLLYGTAPTDVLTFAEEYNIAASTMAQASGHLVISNIPDVTLTPYLSSVQTLAGIVNLPTGDTRTSRAANLFFLKVGSRERAFNEHAASLA